MTSLVIDIGNTRLKAAVFCEQELIWVESYPAIGLNDFEHIIKKFKPQKAIISSVKKNSEAWESGLSQQIELVKFEATMVKSVKNHYLTPKTLGTDRLASVVGARELYKNTGSLIINGGTCITYDWIDAQGNYYGGSISLGLSTRYSALNHYTDSLPLLAPDSDFVRSLGNDTQTAITSGVQNGVKFELAGFITEFLKLEPGLNIILSGGDAVFFDTLLKNSIFAAHIIVEPYLVLKGLNAVIQQHND